MRTRFFRKNNKIIFDESEIVFDFPIKEFIEIEDILVVYLDLEDKVISLEENVFAISLRERKIKWQIEKRNYPTRSNPKMLCPFVGIRFVDNELWLYNWCSKALMVDPKTGKILKEEETR